MMETKILFLDLDGTLLNDEKKITPGNRAALEKALAAGHRVVIATGRPLRSAIDKSRELGLTAQGCFVIAYNGGVVYDVHGEQIVFEKPIEASTACAIARLVDGHNVHVQTYDHDAVIVNPRWDDEALKRYCSVISLGKRVEPTFPDKLDHNPPKVLAVSYTDHEVLEAVAADIRREFSSEVDCFFSCKELLEVVPKGMNKGEAVRSMCARLGISVANSIAVGDAENDLTMIRAAGVGVCMANGSDSVKAVADYITTHDNNHDGIAEVVEKFLL